MNIKRFLIEIAAALIFGIAAILLAFPALSQGPALPPGEFWIECPN